MRDEESLASGGVEARGMYFRPESFASWRSRPSILILSSRMEALAAYSARSQVLRKEVSEVPAVVLDMVRGLID